MDWVRTLILGVGLVLLIKNVNSSATCVEKFLDGQTADTKHEVTEGEKVTLRCDVSNRDPAKDMVYWKFDDEVMSQDEDVIPKYQSKFNVTLEKDVYTISWIAELDDAGKYNCTCTTGGIQYPVWIKRPCDERKHVIKNASKLNIATSVEVLDFLNTSNSYELRVDNETCNNSLTFSIALDCNCTWPEVNRQFKGVWYPCTPDPKDQGKPVKLENSIGQQDTSITPIGCYTGKGSVTYRYRNVFGSIHPVFNCTSEMLGKEYCFYIDEGRSTRPPPLMKIQCTGMCVPTPPTCPDCPIRILLIFLGLTAAITLICFVVVVVVIYCKSKAHDNDTKLQSKKWTSTFTPLALVEVVMLIGDIVLIILVHELCDCKTGPLFLPFYIVFGISLLLAVVTIVICGVYLFCPCKQRGTEDYQGHENHRFSDVTPLTERKKCQICSMNPVEFYLKPCGHLICSICRKSIQNESRQQGNNNRVANCPVCATVQATDIEKLCMICWKKPVQSYFKPCHHSAACLSCTQSMFEKSLQASCPECNKEAKDYQTGICLICLENPVKVLFKPCQHIAACTSCAKSMFEKCSKAKAPLPAQCPKCKKVVKEYELDQHGDA